MSLSYYKTNVCSLWEIWNIETPNILTPQGQVPLIFPSTFVRESKNEDLLNMLPQIKYTIPTRHVPIMWVHPLKKCKKWKGENFLRNVHPTEITIENSFVYIFPDFKDMFVQVDIFLYECQYMPFFPILVNFSMVFGGMDVM